MGRNSLAWAGIALLALLAAARADAHAYLASSDPAAGSRLDHAPSVIHLVFTEDLEPAGTHAGVLDGNGTHHETGQDFPASNRLNVAVAPLGPGTYTVAWTSLSVDTHAVQGSFTFTVVKATPAANASALQAEHLHSGWFAHACMDLGMAAALGMLAFAAWVLPPAARPEARRLLHEFAAIFAAIAFIAAFFLLGDTVASAQLPLWSFLTQTRAGPAWSLRFLILAASSILLWTAHRSARPERRAPLSVALLTAAWVATASTSHAGAQPAGALLATMLDVLHMLAASLWVGGVLAFFIWSKDQDAPTTAVAVQRFGRVALPAVAVLVAAGTLGALLRIKTLHALLATPYGWALLTKIGLLLGLLGCGALERYRLGPRLDRPEATTATFRRVLGYEALLMLLVLLATGVLTTLSPTP